MTNSPVPSNIKITVRNLLYNFQIQDTGQQGANCGKEFLQRESLCAKFSTI